MRVIVTGAHGQLGCDVVEELKKRGHIPVPTDIDTLDITDASCVSAFFAEAKPDAVVHCAAYTAVDKAETKKDICKSVNETGSANIAAACKKTNAKMLYISTDYVYGCDNELLIDTNEKVNPLNFYGLSKYHGETLASKLCDKLFIVRTSWVFGSNGSNFVKTMLRLGKEKNSLRVVSDQIGSPTFTVDLSRLICDMIETEKYGLYHATNEGFCSWYEFAVRIFEKSGISIEVSPVTSEEYGSVAKRPKNSRLSKESLDRAGFSRLPSWQDALDRFLATQSV